MAKVRIEVDVDRFERFFGIEELEKRFGKSSTAGRAPASPAGEDDAVPTLDLNAMEVSPVEGEIEEIDVSTLGVEAVDDNGP